MTTIAKEILIQQEIETAQSIFDWIDNPENEGKIWIADSYIKQRKIKREIRKMKLEIIIMNMIIDEEGR